MMKKLIAFILAVCPLIAQAELAGTNWLLSELGNRKLMLQSPITLNFDADKFNGKDGCNYYRGSYQAQGKQFKVNKQIANTLMACPDSLDRQAAVYMKALTSATTYKIDQQQLILSVKGKIVAKFRQQPSGLEGSSWQVLSVNNGKQAVVSTIIGTELTAKFDKDNITGSAGCNNYRASYQVADKKLNIGDTISTKKFCAEPQGIMEQEAQFLQALKTVTSYEFDGINLRLRTATNATAVVLKRQ